MFTTNFYPITNWLPLDKANTGDSFLIQNCGAISVEFMVLDHFPDDEKDFGGLLSPKEQLSFKKVSGDLYVRSTSKISQPRLFVEKVEA